MSTVKTIPAKTFFYIERQVKLAEIGKVADEVIDPLYAALKTNGLESAGPLEFHYLDADGNPDHEMTLHIAIPIRRAKPVEAPYAVKGSPPFHCIITTYIGGMSGIAAAWEEAMRQVTATGHRMGDEGREVYTKFTTRDAEDNSTEIQVGLD